MEGGEEMITKIPVAVAASLIGKSNRFVMWGIQSGVLPIGSAVRAPVGRNRRYNYFIVPKQFSEYTGIPMLMIEQAVEEYRAKCRAYAERRARA